MSSARQFWVIAHRWAGLTVALFLIVVGATGALLPFQDELTALTAPWARAAPPKPGAPLLDPLALNLAAMRDSPDAVFGGLRLNVEPGRNLMMGAAPRSGHTLDYDTVMIDPYTARTVARFRYGDLTSGPGQLMPFLYRLHYQLALGEWGRWALGIAALVWTIDCFVGFYLTLPVARRGWWRSWRRAWAIRRRTTPYKFNFDLHRAGGLWLWPLLLVFAWSSVGMNLSPVYTPVMRALGDKDPLAKVTGTPAPPAFRPDWPRAYRDGVALAAAAGRRDGFAVRSFSIFFDPATSTYAYYFQASSDFTDHGGWSSVVYRRDGRQVALVRADGGLDQGGANYWLMALHTASVGGLAYRILTSLIGLGIVALSVTGIVIWTKKRSARLLGRRRVPRASRTGRVPVAAE